MRFAQSAVIAAVGLALLGGIAVSYPPTASAPAESAACLRGHAAGAESARKIGWEDLLPPGYVPPPQVIVDHNSLPVFDDFPAAASAETVAEFDGVLVKLPGFVVPLDVVDGRMASFLLVPYFGACIHQPPPPPNQIVYVEFEAPAELDSMYDPVWVTGRLGREVYSGGLATAGYSMQGELIESYSY